MVLKIGIPVSVFLFAFYVAFRFFPGAIHFEAGRPWNDPARYEKQWFSNFSWANLTEQQWKHALAIAPGILGRSTIGSCISAVVLQIFYPQAGKLLLALVFLFWMFFPFVHLIHKVGKHKSD